MEAAGQGDVLVSIPARNNLANGIGGGVRRELESPRHRPKNGEEKHGCHPLRKRSMTRVERAAVAC